MRMRYREIGLIRNLSQRHDYRIPMVTEEGVGMIHLTLVQDAKEKGRISVHLNTQELGTVSVEAKLAVTAPNYTAFPIRAPISFPKNWSRRQKN